MYDFVFRGADLLAVNADGNMPYDICEDDATLDYIEGEMARRGVTQRLIDETRSAIETQMLTDLKLIKSEGQSLMFRDNQGATPVSKQCGVALQLFIDFATGPVRHQLHW